MPKHPIKSQFIVPFCGKVSEIQREKYYGHKAAIIWLTGLPASGKTTIAVELEYRLFQKQIKTFVIDGDNLRQGLSGDLGFALADRVENIRRAGEVAKLFFDAGLIIIASLISPLRTSRDEVRDLIPQGKFIEVFVDCPLAECEQRDPKGLYAMARKGEIPFFTGISAPYEIPLHPEIHLQTRELSVEECTENIMAYLKRKEFISA